MQILREFEAPENTCKNFSGDGIGDSVCDCCGAHIVDGNYVSNTAPGITLIAPKSKEFQCYNSIYADHGIFERAEKYCFPNGDILVIGEKVHV